MNVYIIGSNAFAIIGITEIVSKLSGAKAFSKATCWQALPEINKILPDVIIYCMSGKKFFDHEMISHLHSLHFKPRLLLLENEHGKSKSFFYDEDTVASVISIRSSVFIFENYLRKIYFHLNGHYPMTVERNSSPTLTARELMIYDALLAGKSYIQIARTMNLSAKTVSGYKQTIVKKFRLPNFAALMRQENAGSNWHH